MKERYLKIYNVLYYVVIGFALLTIGKTYYDRKMLPQGVCPVDDNRTMLYIAIGLLVIVFIADFFVKKQQKGSSDDE